MARIRTIKPEFWQDEKLAPMPPIDRLVFLGLIGMADDAGRVLDSVKVVDAFVFPSTPDTCASSLDNLARDSRIIRGVTKSGQRVIQIANWERHQRVDHPNLKACLPKLVGTNEVTEDSRDVREAFPRDSRYDQRPTTNDHLPTTADQPRPLMELRSGWENHRDALTTLDLLLGKMPSEAKRFALVSAVRSYGPGGANEAGDWSDVAEGFREAVKATDKPIPTNNHIGACVTNAKRNRLERAKSEAPKVDPWAAAMARVQAEDARRTTK